ncbi:MAG: putative C-S lyase [Erysipelotrichaceae bacterium]|nr:putative C-S lyase [Erysipelotrichaceae bacterium]
MEYNFDKIIDRSKTDDIKWNRLSNMYEDDIVPMWVADMDLAVASPIIDKIKERLETPIFGYASLNDTHRKLVMDYFNNRFNYGIEIKDISFSTGVVFSISALIQAFTKENDKIMIMLPTYGPFTKVTLNSSRIPIYTYLKLEGDKYVIDFEEMEEIVEDCKVLILCNPHNPTGKIFSKEELIKIAEFAEKHEMLIISDEIHCDFDFNKKFIPIININEYTKNNTVALTSITKSFNLAGLKISFVFIKNEELRKKLNQVFGLFGIGEINTFAIEALKAVYTECTDWMDATIEYIEKNIDYALERFENIPEIKTVKPEGTYLLWLDMSGVNVDKESLHQKLLDEAKVFMTPGNNFGEEFQSYERLNVGCPKSQLKKAIDRIEEFVIEYR